MNMKKSLCLLLTLLLVLFASAAMAAKLEPQSTTIEETVTWESDTLKITIDQWLYAYKNFDLRFYVAVVDAASPEQLRTAFAGERYSKDDTEATGDIAARHNAVLAINGDYYNYKDKIGLVIRNGELFRDEPGSRDHLLVEKDGSFTGLTKAEYDAGLGEEYVARGVQHSFTFGPLLVRDGEIVELPEKYTIYTDEDIREPRTAIGWVDGTKYVVVVADGRRKDWSPKGMNLQELQQVFVQYGCQVAYNLDGGGSATLLLNGELVNRPSGSRQRDVSDIVYFTN